MQHDLHVNPNRVARRIAPLIVVLQSDFAPGPDRLCAPLVRADAGLSSKVAPTVRHDGGLWTVFCPRLHAVSASSVRSPANGSLAAYRDDILRALDFLFTGV